jgi:hypothetical protein
MALYDDMDLFDAVKEVEELLNILHERIEQSREDDDDEDDIDRDEYLADALQVVLDAALKSVKGGE